MKKDYKTIREQFKEPPFGVKLAPVLSEIEDAIIDRQINLPSDKPNYPLDAFRAAQLIFLDAMVDKAADYMEQLDFTSDEMFDRIKALGRDVHLITLKYCDIDTNKLLKYGDEEKPGE